MPARPFACHRHGRFRRRRRRRSAALAQLCARDLRFPRVPERRRRSRTWSRGVRRARGRLRALRLRRPTRHGRARSLPAAVRFQQGQPLLHRTRRVGCAGTLDPAVHGTCGGCRCPRVAVLTRRARSFASAHHRGACRACRGAHEPVASLGARRSRRRESTRLLRAPVRRAADGRGVCAVSSVVGSRSGDRGDRARLPLRRGRDRRGVGPPPSVLRAEAVGREQLHELFPRHVSLLRPVDLRAPSRPRAHGSRCRDAARARARRRLRAAGCVDLDRPLLLLFAVGHGRARGRDGSRHGSGRRPPNPPAHGDRGALVWPFSVPPLSSRWSRTTPSTAW